MNDHDLFELILDQPEPDFPSVVDAAVADGKRVRRRRRLAVPAAGVAVLAIIIGAGMFLVPSHQASVGPAAPVPPATSRVSTPTMPSSPPSLRTSPTSPSAPTLPTRPTWPPSISSAPSTQSMPSGPEATVPPLDAAGPAQEDATRKQESARPESGAVEPESNKPTRATTPLEDAGAVRCMPARTGKCTPPD